jgi:hypothetical protein
MASKNLNLNITVNNKQVDLAKISFKQFDDIIKQAKKDLQALPLNDPRYKTLVSDINAAEKAWKQAQAGAGQFNDEMEEGGGKIKSYAGQIREATAELVRIEQQFGKNSKQYADQAAKIKGLRDAQEDLVRGTQKLDDALSNIPGPIGRAGQAMQQFEVITQSAKSAFNSLGLGFKTVDQIFKTTAIGALVAIIILLVTAIARAAKSFKPLQDAFAQIGGAVDGLFEALRPLTEFLLNVFVGAIKAVSVVIEIFGKGIAMLTGRLEEYNQAASLKKATLELERSIAQQERLFGSLADSFNKYTKSMIDSKLDMDKAILESNKALQDGLITQQQALEQQILIMSNTRAKMNNIDAQLLSERNEKGQELDNLKQVNIIKSYTNERKSQTENIKQSKINEQILIANQQQASQNRIKIIEEQIQTIKNANITGGREVIQALESSKEEEQFLIDYYVKKTIALEKGANAEITKLRKQFSREDIALINERSNTRMMAGAQLLKEEEARALQEATIAITALKERHRKELEDTLIAGQTTKGLKEKQAAEMAAAFENERRQELKYRAYYNQLAINEEQRNLDEELSNTKEYYQRRRDLATEQLNVDLILADGNADKIETARTAHWKKIFEIDTQELQNILTNMETFYDGMYENTQEALDQLVTIENQRYEVLKHQAHLNYDLLEALEKAHIKRLEMIEIQRMEARLNVMNIEFNGLYEGTKAAFDQMRALEDQQYAIEQAKAKNNYDKLQALATQHAKNIAMIDSAELQSKADIEQRKADAVGTIITAHYDMLRYQNDLQTQANIIAAGDNAEKVEAIQLEHLKREKEIGAAEVENAKTIQIAKLQIVADFGALLNNIADQLMAAAQGRDEQQFKNAKKLAIAAITIEKAAAIGQIVANTGIANAKAVAASPLTFGQPWVAINTVSAALAIASTIAAGIQQISQINSAEFQKAGDVGTGGKGGGPNYGRNYEEGGLIGGKRHAQGGTLIEAEQGEAIMTRGAVTMFGPMLSMMNQMGGGTAFGTNVMTTSYDYPNSNRPADNQSQAIIKTYVVEGELTTAQQRQARLKDLSTL